MTPSLEQTLPVAPTQRIAAAWAKAKGALSGRFFRSLFAAGLNTGGAQVIRLAGNLILTRLLFPEAFGLMALVNVFLIGLEMFSDLGIGAALVQRSESPSRKFVQTAWTLQMLRGLILWGAASLAAFPLARFYDEPQLAWVLPVVSLSLAITGFKSPAIHLCARNFHHGAITRLDLVSALIGLAVSISLAALLKSVWALVIGGVVAAICSLILSWRLPEQMPMQFRWDAESRRELIGFGRWIFLSTVFVFLAGNGDRLLLGKFLTLGELGIYTVAFFFAQSVTSFMAGLATRTLFPIFSRLEPGDPALNRYRRLLLAGALLPLGVFLIGGPLLIDLLYDPRYLPAGSLLQWLALGAAVATLRVMAEPVLLARGDSFARMQLAIAEAVIVLGATLIGGSLAGLSGFIVGYVVGQFLTLFPTAWLLHRRGAWSLRDDAAYLAVVFVLAAIGWSVHAPVIALN